MNNAFTRDRNDPIAHLCAGQSFKAHSGSFSYQVASCDGITSKIDFGCAAKFSHRPDEAYGYRSDDSFDRTFGRACAAPGKSGRGRATYRGEIVRVIDGDTIVADIDLSFDVWIRNKHLRLNRIDAPECGTAEGTMATSALRDRIEGKALYLCAVKMKRKDREARGSFGRYLVEIYLDGININDWLLNTGHAVSRE